ncbi:MAG: ACT domain-containing protein [Oscillospiraceae bacterium]|nr:ACT domain-containing protein [Oscillospiraceae bacterium]
MAITQLSVFLENSPGRLAEAVRIISDAGVNIRAMSLADTKDFGILRLIVSDADKAKETLSSNYIVMETKVIAVKMDDQAGALNNILQALEKAQINVEYMYAFTGAEALSAYVILRVDDLENAETVLAESGLQTLTDDKLRAIL